MSEWMQSVANEEAVWPRDQASPQPTDARLPPSSLLRVVVDGLQGGIGTHGARPHDVQDVLPDRNQEFLELLAAYRISGGLARTHEVIATLRNRNGLTAEQLARWNVAHQIISIDWQDQTWFPWFQFDRESGLPRPQVGEVVQVLCSFLDNWQIACWFVLPNPGVDDPVPLDNLDYPSVKVLAAAQAFRMRFNDQGRRASFHPNRYTGGHHATEHQC